MKNLDALLTAPPAVVMFGATIYIKNTHEGISWSDSIESVEKLKADLPVI